MAALPYMPLYVADYLADAAHLSTLEHGAYLLLIMTYWQRGEPLPDDDKKLSRIARMTPDEWASVRESVAEFFTQEDGRWVHGRIDRELAFVRDKSDKARTAGKASADRRSNVRSTDAQRTLNHTDTEAETEAEQQDAREARAAAPPDDHADLKLTLRHAAGLEEADAPGLDDVSPVLDLIAKGYSLSDRILPVLRRKRAAFAKPGSWAYFVPAIVEAEERAGGIATAKAGTPAASVWIDEGSTAWAAVTKARGKPPLKAYHNGQAGAWVRADELKGQAA